jgi:hypothetical protein
MCLSHACDFELKKNTTFSGLNQNTFLSTPFFNTLSLCQSLNVKDPGSCTHKAAGNVTVPYIIIFTRNQITVQNLTFFDRHSSIFWYHHFSVAN